jgi:hypothetical protein
MLKAVFDCPLLVLFCVSAIERLQEVVSKIQVFEPLRVNLVLWKYQFQFVAGVQNNFGMGLWANTNPIQAPRRLNGAVGFNRNFKAIIVKLINQSRVELEQGFSTCTDDERMYTVLRWFAPDCSNARRQIVSIAELSAARAISSYEICVAESAYRQSAVFLSSTPEVASSESAKDRGSAGVSPFALQGVKDFFY